MKQMGLAALLLLSLVAPATTQGGAIRVSLLGSAGWLEPLSTLASPNPEFAFSARHGSIESGAVIGVGVQVDLPSPIPGLRLTGHQLLGSELVVEGPESVARLGSATISTVLLEGVFSLFGDRLVSPRLAVGAGFKRYEFPEIEDEELARLFKDGQVSPMVSIGAGASFRIGSAELRVDAVDLISTFDSPPVTSQRDPSQTIDIDQQQHDLRLTLGVRVPLGWP